jgi:hypothetical protein
MEKMIERWLKVKESLDSYKKRERELRDKIVGKMLGENFGVAKEQFGNYLVKAQIKLREQVDAKVLVDIWAELTDDERNAIRNKPELKLREYHSLSPEAKIHEAVVAKPSAPTLEVKPLTSK